MACMAFAWYGVYSTSIWCMLYIIVCGVWCIVCGVWCVVCGVQDVKCDDDDSLQQLVHTAVSKLHQSISPIKC